VQLLFAGLSRDSCTRCCKFCQPELPQLPEQQPLEQVICFGSFGNKSEDKRHRLWQTTWLPQSPPLKSRPKGCPSSLKANGICMTSINVTAFSFMIRIYLYIYSSNDFNAKCADKQLKLHYASGNNSCWFSLPRKLCYVAAKHFNNPFALGLVVVALIKLCITSDLGV